MLFAPAMSSSTYLVGSAGVVHEWRSAALASGPVVLLDSGHLLRAAHTGRHAVFSGGGKGGRLQELDWDGDVLWDFEFHGPAFLQHHSFEPTPHGTILLIAWEHKTRAEVLAAGRHPERASEDGLWPDFVAEIEPLPPRGGRVVWEWHAWDHLVQDLSPELPNHGVVREHPGRLDINAVLDDGPPVAAQDVEALRALGYAGDPQDTGAARNPGDGHPSDWIHANAIDYDPESDRILLCSREWNEIWVIDHSISTEEARGRTGGQRKAGGDLLARFGNPANHGAGASGEQTLFHPHGAHWIPRDLPGAGNILLFNNGPHPKRGRSSEVLELALADIATSGSEARPRTTMVWSCTEIDGAPFYSGHFSGAQRLPSGNTLVTLSTQGRWLEITPAGARVREGSGLQGTDGSPPAMGTDSGEALAGSDPPPARVALFTWIPGDHPGLARLRAADQGQGSR